MKKLLISLLFLCVAAVPSLAQSTDDVGGTVVEGAPSSGGSGGGSFTGGTLTNPLLLSEDPSQNAEAVTLRYLNTVLGPINTALPTAVLKTGSTMSGVLTLNDASPAASQAYVAAHGGSGAFNGGTVSNPIVLPADPTSSLQAATKAYVDGHVGGASLPSSAIVFGITPTTARATTATDINGLYQSTAYVLGNAPYTSTAFTGTAGATIVGTRPELLDIPNASWILWPGAAATWTFKSGGGITSSTAVGANLIDLGSSVLSLTYSGLTNTNGLLLVVKYADGNNFVGVDLLGSGGVTLSEWVGGVITAQGTSAVANGATGNVVVTISGLTITVTPFGGTPIVYTIPSGHADATGTKYGFFARTSTAFTIGGMSSTAPGLVPASAPCSGYLASDSTCSTPSVNAIAATDGNGHLAPLPEEGTSTVTVLGQPLTTIAWKDDFKGGMYDPRDPRWGAQDTPAHQAASIQAMSNQMACDLSMGVVKHAVAKWPQGNFTVDQLLIAPGSDWEGVPLADGGTLWKSQYNNHFLAQAPGSMTVTCSDGLSHTDSNGSTHISHFTLVGCATGGCTNAAGDTGVYTVGGPGNTGFEMDSTTGIMEHMFAQNFGGWGLRLGPAGQDTKAFHNRVYNNLSWYYFGSYKGVGESPSSPEANAVTTGTTGSVALSWTAVPSAAGYVVYRGSTAGGESAWFSTATNSLTDTGAAGTAGTVTNVNTTTVAIPGTITATPSTTGGALAAGTYYYKVTAYTADGWHGSIEFFGLDGMSDWTEAYGFQDAPTVYTYHHLANVLTGGGDSHYDHIWAQLGQVGIAQGANYGANNSIENFRVDFARLEGIFITDTNVRLRGGIVDGSCTAANARTINTGQEGSWYAGMCDQFVSVGGGGSLSDTFFGDNSGFGPTFKTADMLTFSYAAFTHNVVGTYQYLPSINGGIMAAGGVWDAQSTTNTSVTGPTPSLMGLKYIVPSDSSPITYTSFTSLQIGQDFYVLGGNANVTLQNNADIVTCSGQNINLAAPAIYHFIQRGATQHGATEECTSGSSGGGGGSSTILASSETVSFSATPTFAMTTRSSIITLTSNVTSFTLGAGADGQEKTLIFCQNSTGGYTVTPPSNVHGFMTLGATASKCNAQHYTYSGAQSAWLSDGPGTVNQ